MTTAATMRRPAAALVVLLVTVLVSLALPPADAHAAVDAGAERQFVSAVNRERAARGLPALQVAGDLTSVARQHSVRMANGDNLHHNPDLASHVSNWQKVGENVGTGPSVSSIHAAFMNSASHRANVLDGDWTQVGIGVEVRGDTIWVTQVFRLPAGASTPAWQPAPEPEPQAQAQAETSPRSGSDTRQASPATASTPSDPSSDHDVAPAADPEPAVEALPPVAPEADRALAMMTRVAAEDADLDGMTD